MKKFRKKITSAAIALLILSAASTAALAEEGSPGREPSAMGPCDAWSPPELELAAEWDTEDKEILVSVTTEGWENIGILSFRLTYPEDLSPVEKLEKVPGLEGSSIVWNEDGLYVLWMSMEGCAMSEAELLTLRLDASASEAEDWTLELSNFCFSDPMGRYTTDENTGISSVTVVPDTVLPEIEEEPAESVESSEEELAESVESGEEESTPETGDLEETETGETETGETDPEITNPVEPDTEKPDTEKPSESDGKNSASTEETIQTPETEPEQVSESETVPSSEEGNEEVFE